MLCVQNLSTLIDTDTASAFGLIAALIVALVLYFLPAIIASRKKKRNATAIGVLNLLLGWTVAGWIISLIWALTNDPPVPAG
jgi:hypothetical protein